jgi:hypothetical protein
VCNSEVPACDTKAVNNCLQMHSTWKSGVAVV